MQNTRRGFLFATAAAVVSSVPAVALAASAPVAGRGFTPSVIKLDEAPVHFPTVTDERDEYMRAIHEKAYKMYLDSAFPIKPGAQMYRVA